MFFLLILFQMSIAFIPVEGEKQEVETKNGTATRNKHGFTRESAQYKHFQK